MSPSSAGAEPAKSSWRFPAAFWAANGAEMLERAAFYGMFISLSLYLTRLVGFTDVQSGWIAAFFSGFLYFAPTFAGAAADHMGFRKSLVLAFVLLAAGYGGLGALQTKPSTLFFLLLVLIGGAFIKSVITGTVAKTSSEVNRARAFSIFYQVVNIGAFSGKMLAKPLRTGLGLEYINFASAAMCVVAIGVVLLFYRESEESQEEGKKRSLSEAWSGLLEVLTNVRFITLIIIVGGFWAIQHQLYATMPKYVLRTVGENAAPEWYANVNPFVVVLLVIPITHLVRKIHPVTSMAIALAIIPVSAFTMSLSPQLAAITGPQIVIWKEFSLHPITVMLVLGIALQALSECFLSPRFLEYASKQAPKGQTALYMGYSHLTSFFGNLLGFGISGYLLRRWCPNPEELEPAVQAAHRAALAGEGPMPEAYLNAHHIWWVFSGIGVCALVALIAYRVITERIDRTKAQADAGAGA